jgi:hypothetical protein
MDSKPIQFILHIGQHKTGSTAIQKFLFQNQKLLFEKHSVLYPDFYTDRYLTEKFFNHQTVLYHVQKAGIPEGTQEKFGKCVEFCRQNSIQKLVISNENLSRNKDWPGVFHLLGKKFALDVKIIVYLRRQDYWIESSWKESGCKDPRYQGIRDYAPVVNMDWYEMLTPWLEFFSPHQFVVRPFEKEVIGENAVNDFAGLLGIDASNVVEDEASYLMVNPGYSHEILEILNLCKIGFKLHDETQVPYNPLHHYFFYALPEKYRRKDPFSPYGLLSPVERLEIIEKYEESNMKLARLLLPGGDEKLFHEPLPDLSENWTEPKKLTIEKAIPVLIDLLMYQHEKFQNHHKAFYETRGGFNSRLVRLNERIVSLPEQMKKYLNDRINLLEKTIDRKLHETNQMSHERYVQEWIESVFSFETIEPVVIQKSIRYINGIGSIAKTEDGLHIQATGEDPYFILRLPLSFDKPSFIKIVLTAPARGNFQLFFRKGIGRQFCERYSIRKPVMKGRNILYIKLPGSGVDRKIRIDPGTQPGLYILHSMGIAR